MKFVCERCQTKYSIADEKVRQKVLKIRCKTCENVITIRDAVVVSEPAIVRSEPPPAPAQAPRSVEWHLAVSGQQSGPFGLSALVSRIAAASRSDEIYVWNEHLDGWKEPRLVPEVAAEMRLRAASIDPPAPPAGASRRTHTPVAGQSQLPRAGSSSGGSSGASRGGRSGAMAAVAKLEPAEEAAEPMFEEKTQISPLDASMMLGATDGGRAQPARGISAHGARPEARRPESRTTEHAPTESRRSEKPAFKPDPGGSKGREKAPEAKPANKTIEEKPSDVKHADLGMASLLSVLPASNGHAARKTTGAGPAASSGLEALDFAPPLVAPSQPALDFPAAARNNGVPTPVVGGNTSMLLAQVGAKAAKPRHPGVKYGIIGLLLVGLVGVMVVVTTSGEDKKAANKVADPAPAVATAPDPEAVARAEAEKYFKSMVGEGAPAASAAPSTKSVGPAPTPRRSPARRNTPEPAPIALAPPPMSGGSGAGDGQRITQRFASEERRVAVPTSSRGGKSVDDFDISKFMAVFKQPDHHGAIKSCYERALKRDANLKLARLDINVTVGETGSAKKVRIDAPSEFNAVSSCIRDSVRRWRFPSSQREYEAAFPLILQGGSE
ncbi:MAG TPA: AgmX/PglI C-terminal domain-containing protein [Polyangia bacterium]